MADYHYSAQIRKFILQFQKIWSLWQISTGKNPDGTEILTRVPVMYGDSSRQAATIIANNSANNIPSAPLITTYMTGLEYNQKWTTAPTFVDHMQVRQREYNKETQTSTTLQGQAFTIDRLMPVPYILKMSVDIWTTNLQQKLELIEQLGILFNPALEIQSNDNYMDWTSLSAVFQDGINFTSRSIPQGTGNQIDILTWKFWMPIWLTPPAKLKKMGVIHKVIASIHDGSDLYDITDDDLLMGTRQKITPLGYKLLLLDGKLQLLPANAAFNPSNESLTQPTNPNTNVYWSAFLNLYGAIRPGISQIWIQNPYMKNDIVGTITPDPDDDRFLTFDIDLDTLPQNTLSPVNAVIDPSSSGPGAGLPSPTNGTRYLIVEGIGSDGSPSEAWGDLIASANDIIEYSAGTWSVSFDASTAAEIEYVTNLKTSVQYRFINEVNMWTKSYEGFVESGNFSIVI